MASTQTNADSNRRNSDKSTGPKTEAGKARSSLNSRTHGILTSDAVNPAFDSAEDCAKFAAICAFDLEYHQPAGPLETMLVEKISAAQWRLKKCDRFEAARAYDDYCRREHRDFEAMGGAASVSSNDPNPHQVEAYRRAMKTAGLDRPILPSNADTAIMLRYRAAADRELFRALRELERIQKDPKRERWLQSHPDGNSAAGADGTPAASENYETKPNGEIVERIRGQFKPQAIYPITPPPCVSGDPIPLPKKLAEISTYSALARTLAKINPA